MTHPRMPDAGEGEAVGPVMESVIRSLTLEYERQLVAKDDSLKVQSAAGSHASCSDHLQDGKKVIFPCLRPAAFRVGACGPAHRLHGRAHRDRGPQEGV